MINTQPPYGQQSKSLITRPNIIILAILAIVILFMLFVVSALRTRASTGILHVEATDTNAQLFLYLPGKEPRSIGEGKTSIRLVPGTYVVGATSDGMESRQSVAVTEETEAEARLNLQPLVPHGRVLPMQATDILADGEKLYFLDPTQASLATYQLGDAFARPYRSYDNNVRDIAWLNPTTYYTRVKDEWLIGGTKTKLFNLEGEIANTDSVSFNQTGAVAFTTHTSLVAMSDAANGQFRGIGRYEAADSRTSLAPDGSLAVYAPNATNYGKKERTHIFSAGTVDVLEDSLSGIDNVVWSPDSSKFSYTDRGGAYIYDTALKAVTQILTEEPSQSGSLTWVDDSTVLYGHGQAVWAYSLEDATSFKLLKTDGSFTGNGPFGRSDDGVTFYFSTVSGDKGTGGYISSFFPTYAKLPTEEQQALRTKQLAYGAVSRPSITGFDDLKAYGATDDQLSNLTYALGNFARQSNLKLKQIKLGTIGTVTRDPVTFNDIIDFKVAFDNRTYQARMEYTLLTKSTITVFDGRGGVLYSSGELDSKN